MKKFKLTLVTLLISTIWVIIGAVRLSRDNTPDAGFGIFNYLLAGLVLSSAALLIDLYFAFGRSVDRSQSPFVKNKKAFWKIIGGLVVVGFVYMVYVLAAT